MYILTCMPLERPIRKVYIVLFALHAGASENAKPVFEISADTDDLCSLSQPEKRTC